MLQLSSKWQWSSKILKRDFLRIAENAMQKNNLSETAGIFQS